MKHTRKIIYANEVSDMITNLKAIESAATSSAYFVGDVRCRLLPNTSVSSINFQLTFSHFEPSIVVEVSPWIHESGRFVVGGRVREEYGFSPFSTRILLDSHISHPKGGGKKWAFNFIRLITSELRLGEWIL